MLTCREVAALLDTYFDGALAEPEASLVAAHLATCPECTRELHLRWWEKEVLLSCFEAPELDPQFARRVCARIAQKKPGLRLRGKPWLALSLAALAALALLVTPLRPEKNAPERRPQTLVRGAEHRAQTSPPEAPPQPKTAPLVSGSGPAQEHFLGRAETEKEEGAAPQMAAAGREEFPFRLTYLPPGFAPTPREDKGATAFRAAFPPTERRVYVNEATGEEIVLEVTLVEATGEETGSALQETGGESVLSWYARKGEKCYLLKLSGSVPPEELRKVAAGII